MSQMESGKVFIAQEKGMEEQAKLISGHLFLEDETAFHQVDQPFMKGPPI
jgi:hypothetical protein